VEDTLRLDNLYSSVVSTVKVNRRKEAALRSGEAKIMLSFMLDSRAARQKAAANAGSNAAADGDDDWDWQAEIEDCKPDEGHAKLYEMAYDLLAAWRESVANRRGCQPNMIFGNSTLERICARMPSNHTELESLQGVSRNKSRQHGARILQLLREVKAHAEGQAAGRIPMDQAPKFVDDEGAGKGGRSKRTGGCHVSGIDSDDDAEEEARPDAANKRHCGPASAGRGQGPSAGRPNFKQFSYSGAAAGSAPTARPASPLLNSDAAWKTKRGSANPSTSRFFQTE